MNTRTFAFVLSSLVAASVSGVPGTGHAQVSNEIAMVANLCSADCVTALVFPGGMTDNPHDRAPTWSPDAARIAFERDGEIMVFDVAGGAPSNLTNHPAQDSSPAWSPVGSKIAFASDRDGQAELYLMNTDGSGVVRRTYGIGFAGEPAWSPDARAIVFTCVIESGNADICAINADGTGFARLTSDPAQDSGPAWSPDGARIAFATSRYSPTPLLGPPQVATMNADGSGVNQVGPGGTWGSDPAWSPDGTRIAFVDYMQVYPDYFSYVFVMNADGTEPTEVAEGFDPAWRPGPGAVPAVALSPGSLAFASQLVGSSSSPQTVTLTNTGTAQLVISSIVTSGDFAQFNNCGANVAAGANCTISVTFTPTGSGSRSGLVTITDNAPGSPHVISLGGTGYFESMHVGDLDGASANQKNTWTAAVTVAVEDNRLGWVSNATVSGAWSSGGTSSCTTNGNGQCTLSKTEIPKKTASTTFTVGNVAHATLSYSSAANHDPDGDSNGTSIAVMKP